MVGGFVKHQHVRFLQHQLAENQPRRFSSGERSSWFQGVLAAEQHLAQHAAQFLLRRLGIELVQPFDGSRAFLDGVGVVLREVTDRHFVAPLHVAAIDLEMLVPIVNVSGRVADQRFQQRGLARTVAAR